MPPPNRMWRRLWLWSAGVRTHCDTLRCWPTGNYWCTQVSKTSVSATTRVARTVWWCHSGAGPSQPPTVGQGPCPRPNPRWPAPPGEWIATCRAPRTSWMSWYRSVCPAPLVGPSQPPNRLRRLTSDHRSVAHARFLFVSINKLLTEGKEQKIHKNHTVIMSILARIKLNLLTQLEYSHL